MTDLEPTSRLGYSSAHGRRAARRKPEMLLLPYAIPIAVGTITYFTCAGFLS